LAKIDEQKEIVATWRFALFFVLGAIFTLIGYVFNSYNKLNEIQLILSNIAGLFLLMSFVFIVFKLKTEIKKLGDME
jgi:sulfite exporter TauE/SafE